MKIRNLVTAALFSVALVSAAVAQAPAVAASPAVPAPNQMVYLNQLPSPADLNNAAAAQGLKIDRIDQADGRLTVTYTLPNGQANVVAYALISTIEPGSVPSPATPAPAPTATTVAYGSAPVVYYDYGPYGPYYYPYYPWIGPVGISLGFGWGHGWGWGRGWGGGFHGHW